MLVQPDGKVLFSGSFSVVRGEPHQGILRLNPDLSIDHTFDPSGISPSPGSVSCIALQSDGKVLIFQDFNLKRLNADGSLDSSFNAGTNAHSYISSIAVQDDGKVLIGSIFLALDPPVTRTIARLNTDGSLDAGFDTHLDETSSVRSIALQKDGKVLIAGDFIHVNGMPRNRFARLNADGSLDGSFNPEAIEADSHVNCVAVQADGKLLIAGSFLQANGAPRSRIARLNADGSLDASFDRGDGADYWVTSVVLQGDGKALVQGEFSSVNGTQCNRLARLNVDGSLDANFHPICDQEERVYQVAVQEDGKVLVGGYFRTVNGSPRIGIKRLSSVGGQEASFSDPGGGANSTVWAMAVQQDGKALIGGDFTSVNDTPRNRVARLNPDGSLDPSFNPGSGPSYNVGSVALQEDGKVVIGGLFSSVDGTPRNNVARLNADGSLDSSFDPGSGPNSQVAVAVQRDGKVLIGGGFNYVNGIPRKFIARLDSDGGVDPSFNSSGGPDDWVYSVAVLPDGKVLICGFFTHVTGTARNRIARLNSDGSLDPSFDPGSGPNQGVYSMAVQDDGKMLLAGPFTGVHFSSRNGIARLNADGSLDESFDPGWGANDWVNSVALQRDGKVLIGGRFIHVNNVPRHGVARLNTDGSLDLGFNPSTANATIFAIAQQSDGRVLLGGNFEVMGGVSALRLARVFGDFSFDVGGTPGLTAVLESSTDFLNWTPIQTNMLGNVPLRFSDSSPSSTGFYRARSQ